MVMLDETGGKPASGYGSGDNSGSPVATPQETAEMLTAQASALKADIGYLCRGPQAMFSFGGDFCQSAIQESLKLRAWASVLESKPSLTKLTNGLRRAGAIAGKVGLGLTTPKGIVYATGV